MINEKFKKVINRGGKKLILINASSIILTYIIGYLIIGHDIVGFINSTSGIGDYSILGWKAGIYSIAQMLFVVFLSGGLYFSSKAIIEEEELNINIFFKNCVKNFWRTLGYSFAICLGYSIIIGIPVFAVSLIIQGLFHIDTKVLSTIALFILMVVIATPKLILNILNIDTSNFIKRNWRYTLPVAVVMAVIAYIPLVGPILVTVINSIYPLFILSLWEESEVNSEMKIEIVR